MPAIAMIEFFLTLPPVDKKTRPFFSPALQPATHTSIALFFRSDTFLDDHGEKYL